MHWLAISKWAFAALKLFDDVFQPFVYNLQPCHGVLPCEVAVCCPQCRREREDDPFGAHRGRPVQTQEEGREEEQPQQDAGLPQKQESASVSCYSGNETQRIKRVETREAQKKREWGGSEFIAKTTK